MAKTVYDVLISKFKEEVAVATQFLGDGCAKDHAEYREMVGFLQGLKLTIQTIEDLKRSQMREEDDD